MAAVVDGLAATCCLLGEQVGAVSDSRSGAVRRPRSASPAPLVRAVRDQAGCSKGWSHPRRLFIDVLIVGKRGLGSEAPQQDRANAQHAQRNLESVITATTVCY